VSERFCRPVECQSADHCGGWSLVIGHWSLVNRHRSLAEKPRRGTNDE
jgi:hypothetical protein